MTIKLTREQSEAQAVFLKAIQDNFMKLDIDYLEQALEEMENSTSFQMSAMVLNPDPFTAIEKVDLNKAKNDQLRLYLKAAQGLKRIMEAEIQLAKARNNSRNLEDLFR